MVYPLQDSVCRKTIINPIVFPYSRTYFTYRLWVLNVGAPVLRTKSDNRHRYSTNHVAAISDFLGRNSLFYIITTTSVHAKVGPANIRLTDPILRQSSRYDIFACCNILPVAPCIQRAQVLYQSKEDGPVIQRRWVSGWAWCERQKCAPRPK